MRCLICLEERPGTVEHVFPLAIGGSFTTDRLCADCNSLLGRTVDTALIKHPFIAFQRSRFDLPGNSGQVPDGARELIGNAFVADESGQRVRVSTRADGVVDPRLVHHEQTLVDERGEVGRRVSIDARDAHLLPKIIGRQRKREGLPVLSADELHEQVAAAIAGRRTLKGPWLRGKLSVDLEDYKAGVLKIAYELACLWFGDAFLDGAIAAEMREVLTGRREFAETSLTGGVMLGGLLGMPWWRDPSKHVAYAVEVNGWATVSVGLFDIVSATFVVGDAATLECDRFIELDVVAGSHRQTGFRTELRRVTHRLKKALLLGSTSLGSLNVIGRATLAAPPVRQRLPGVPWLAP